MTDWKSMLCAAGAQRLIRSAWRHGLRPGSPAAICFALACVALAAVVRLLTGLITAAPLSFVTFYPATLIVTLVGGVWVGLLAAALGGFIGIGWLTAQTLPTHFGAAEATNLLLYAGASAVIIWSGEQYRRLVRHLDQEEHFRQVLVEELGHRLQNKLAAVHAILRHELRNTPEIWASVSGRLRALAATDELIAQPTAAGIDLARIVRTELTPFDETRCRIEGPPTQVPPKLAVTLALVFHELVTNAAKYGALAIPHGCVVVAWTVLDGRACVRWREIGGPRIAIEPVRRGFGRRLIEDGLGPFGGSAECKFEPEGLDCRIEFPLAA